MLKKPLINMIILVFQKVLRLGNLKQQLQAAASAWRCTYGLYIKDYIPQRIFMVKIHPLVM